MERLCSAQKTVEDAQALLFRGPDAGEEEGLGAARRPRDGHGRDAEGVLVQMSIGDGYVGAPQFGEILGGGGVRLGEDGAPAHRLSHLLTKVRQIPHVHLALNGDGRHFLGKMKQITHETPWQ